ncbi:MAG: hypothetical protein Q9M20_05125 [Mariprofundaceae bacterium]|nr:hypothetical protein [Mariprofundaceae bacterium]
MNKTAVRKIKMTEAKNDFSYWQGQSFESRLEALEQIRNEYISWKYDHQQRLQRVYRVIKKK